VTPRPDRPGTRPPWPIVGLAVTGALLFVLPLIGLMWRAPWSSFGHSIADHSVRTAMTLSLQCSLTATALAIVFGIPVAWTLARVEFTGKRLARALVTLPMVLPPVVGGLALLLAFGRKGLIGQWLFDWFGWRIAFTTTGVVLAETFVSMPFFIVTVEAAIAAMDTRLEEAARTMAAGPWTVFRTVTLPTIAPALGAGAVLCWARALGEFGATVTFAANVEGVTQTIPLKVYLALETDPASAITLGVLLLAISVAILVALRSNLKGAWWPTR
jgi:molybdate transport system permease protein